MRENRALLHWRRSRLTFVQPRGRSIAATNRASSAAKVLVAGAFSTRAPPALQPPSPRPAQKGTRATRLHAEGREPEAEEPAGRAATSAGISRNSPPPLTATTTRIHRNQIAVDTRFHFHFTPTSASWLNMVERFFRDLSEKALKRGSFYDVNDLIGGITEYVNQHNDDPTPYIWTASATDILEKVKRARRALLS